MSECLSLDDILNNYRPGSHDWDWHREFTDLVTRDFQAIHELSLSIKEHGIQNPLLLGDDKRVWDGHHRICAAILAGIYLMDEKVIPVEYGHGS